MSGTATQAPGWTAETFLQADQHAFGDAWRDELVEGHVVAHAAPTPDHGAILAGLTAALATRLRGNSQGCRPESGSGAVPTRQQRNTARFPDAMIRCGDQPRVVLEIVSPTELRDRRARDRKRHDLQDTAGVMEVVEIYQDVAAHTYRRQTDGSWTFDLIEGEDSILRLDSVAIAIPLMDVFEFV